MKKEIWKSIEGFEGYYEISNLGAVRSLERIIINKRGGKRIVKARTLKTCIAKNGYERVVLTKGGKSTMISVHRLIGFAFIPRVEDKNHINHKDGNRSNNEISNLEWCTPKENIADGVKRGTVVFPNYIRIPGGKDFCYMGHPLTPDNVTVIKGKYKNCIICHRRVSLKYRIAEKFRKFNYLIFQEQQRLALRSVLGGGK